MALTGTWHRTSVENRQEFLELVGVPDETMQRVKSSTAKLVLKQDGSTVEETLYHGDEIHHTDLLKIGEKSIVSQWNKKTVEAVPELLAENQYTVKYHFEGHDYIQMRQLVSPTELVDTLDLDNGKVRVKLTYSKP